MTVEDAHGPIVSRPLDDRRIVDYDGERHVVGIEFLFVSKGVDLEGLPERGRIAEVLRSFPRVAA